MNVNNPTFIDTHCHFDFDVFQHDFEQQLQLATEAGVEKIVLPAIGESNWDRVESLSSCHPELYYALGLHPYFLDQHSDDALHHLEQRLNARSPRCVAVGECGLDLMIEPQHFAQQEILFSGQCDLAIQFQLPLILHSRKAHDQVLKTLRQKKPISGGVIHGFSGSLQQAESFIKLGFYIGVGGTISYERANKTRKVIGSLPLEFLVLETDAPDMPLSGYQGKSNHPYHVSNIFNHLCLLRSESPQTVASQLKANSNRLFDFCG
ncbi:TatD family hydrolase [Vibrio sp. Of7-15]|uniref:TatD family hydrolase n=1 Tax=Vibrio sp. Of7-15 TaxID=2724879 RepID=UPI001EF26776|nr:TatD family hydrolase [Vibrio sp. Of7-15]MCG7497539.1 TatD family hydrolase [Vibrio sp. Of7-15]